jgi:hypothetical protein
MAGAVVVYWLVGSSGGSVSQLRQVRDEKAQEVAKKQARLDAAERSKAKLAEWERRALPANTRDAGRLYQSWLTGLVGRIKLDDVRIEPREGRVRRGVYTALPFTVHGKATLDQLTRLLFEFYSAGYLHQIQQLTVTPLKDSGKLDVNMAIEAVSLPTATSTTGLPDQKPLRPLPGTLAEYQKTIVERNLFKPYTPPPPPTPPPQPRKIDPPKPPPDPPKPPPDPPKPPIDHLQFAVVDAITEINGKREVWLWVRTTDEKFFLAEGDSFKVGQTPGKVLKIPDLDQVEIAVDGKKLVIPRGGNLRDGKDTPVSLDEANSAGKTGSEKSASEKPKEDARKPFSRFGRRP